MDTTVGPAKPEAPRLREEGGLSSLPNFQGILRGKRRKGGKDRGRGRKGKGGGEEEGEKGSGEREGRRKGEKEGKRGERVRKSRV